MVVLACCGVSELFLLLFRACLACLHIYIYLKYIYIYLTYLIYSVDIPKALRYLSYTPPPTPTPFSLSLSCSTKSLDKYKYFDPSLTRAPSLARDPILLLTYFNSSFLLHLPCSTLFLTTVLLPKKKKTTQEDPGQIAITHTMSPPSEVKAIVIEAVGKAAIKTVPLPQQRDDYILVRTTAVGLNPTDWKHVQGFGDAVGARLGCDWAGVVEHVGSQVTKSFSKGDRIAGVAHGGNARQNEDGAFAEYIMVKGDLAFKIPDNLTDEEAATLGVGISTVVRIPSPRTAHDSPLAMLFK